MKLIKILIACVFAAFFVASCGKKVEELKSPCVAGSDVVSNQNPCDNRINPNFGWMGRVA